MNSNSRKFWTDQLEKAKDSNNLNDIKNYEYLLATYNDVYFDNLEQFYATLPKDGDLTLLILKGHLLIEQQIRSFVFCHFPNQKALKAQKWDADRLISMGRAYCEENCAKTMAVWDCFKKLNSIRNHMAHRLDGTGLDHKISDFLKTFEPLKVWGTEDNIFDQVSSALNTLHQRACYLATSQEKRFENYQVSKI